MKQPWKNYRKRSWNLTIGRSSNIYNVTLSFIRNAQAVEAMRVPHPVRGTISLVEWHMARARNHINVLEENMTLLMEQANANESLFYRLLNLQGRLAAASSLDDMLMRFHRWARELGLAGATVRLFPDRWRLGAPSKFTHLALSRQAFEPLRIQRLGQSQHYLGPLNGPELLVMMPEAKAIGSVAMSMLGQDGSLASCCSAAVMLIITSKGKARSYCRKSR